MGKLYRGWLAMNESCEHCRYRYARDPGYFLGAIYFNYGLTALLTTISFVSLVVGGYDSGVLIWPHAAFCLLFPLWFFRYARSLWVGFDQFFDPVGIEKEEGTGVSP